MQVEIEIENENKSRAFGEVKVGEFFWRKGIQYIRNGGNNATALTGKTAGIITSIYKSEQVFERDDDSLIDFDSIEKGAYFIYKGEVWRKDFNNMQVSGSRAKRLKDNLQDNLEMNPSVALVKKLVAVTE